MRRLAAAAVAVAALGLALLPGPAHAACTTPELPVAGCVVPGATPSPTAPPAPAAPPPTTPAAVPAGTAAAAPAATPEPASQPVQVAAVPALGPAVPPAPAVPAVPPPVLGAPAAAQVVVPAAAQPAAAAPFVPLSGVVASSFALVAFGLLALALLLSFLAGLRPAPAPPGGTMNSHRTRLWAGLGVLAAAAVVGGVGWYRLSGEPLLNRQVPFLASAGILVVLLSVLGGSLIIAEQLRGDQNRIGELEDAVRALTEALSPLVEQPPRTAQEEELSPQPGRGRSRAGAAGRT